ncbi:sugar ABC transporter substrate-binding protein [Aeromicrobium wangtongii]|uniref:Substrate-binding domain-containing protein n=1 Tax=Aeromicrobium wangtongii TaxID=2969247 RepID=A0ABY5M8I5_9ACTN|nr:substrate-binding domain-containing protein [Aeromicrobium wangtongii]MCD9199810.1 substrate-binding domain-containing protein [Aeromicrobium wangtongii]UUP13431.1 substrate-binding domain-containing protein [Aeromicrobium wangtongii]
MALVRHTTRPRVAVAAAVAAFAMLGACAQGSEQEAGNDGSDADSAAGIAAAKDTIAALSKPVTEYPAEPALSKPVDLKGKKVTVIPLGDNIPVIHGVAIGVEDALEPLGASVSICDGKFNPSSVADCLKQAGDQGADAVISLFIDYEMAGTAFDALAKRGVPVVVGGVAPSGGRTSDDTLAFYDNTGRVSKLYETMSEAAVAHGGAATNVLWLRLMDSTTTRSASDAGIKKFKQLCPSCGVATADFTTANIDKLPSAVSSALVANKDTTTMIVPVDSFVPPAMQGLQAAGLADKVKVVSSSSDLAGLQRVRDGQQISDLGTPVIYEGWKYANALMQLLAGDEVQKADAMVTRDFNPDNIGELELTDKAYFTPDWFGGGEFKQAFRTAWGVK